LNHIHAQSNPDQISRDHRCTQSVNLEIVPTTYLFLIGKLVVMMNIYEEQYQLLKQNGEQAWAGEGYKVQWQENRKILKT
jgi:hypothetical protein